jgi:acetyltransferase
MFRRLFGIKPAPKPRKREVKERRSKRLKAKAKRQIKKPARKKLKAAPRRAAPKIVTPTRKGDGIKALFEPRGIMIVGASGARSGTAPALFRSVVDNVSRAYKGKTYIVDLSGRTEGAFKDVKEVRGKAELAVLALPQDIALKNIKKIVDAGIRAMVVSPSYGEELREELLEARKRGVRILGPNSTMGVVNTRIGLCTSFREIMPKQGGIAVLSQSNSVGAAVLDLARFQGVGVSKYVSLGDGLDIDEADLIKYFSEDNATRVICVGIGDVQDGRKFVDALRAAAEKKPVVVLRAGIARLEDKIYDAALKQARAIRVRDVEEMLDVANALAKQPQMAGDKIAIISNAHGPAVLAVDAMHREGLTLAKLGEKTAKGISHVHPDIHVANPIELSVEARAKQYELVLKKVLVDPNVDGVMVINMLKPSLLEIDDVRAIAEVLKKFKKPVVDVAMGGESYMLVRDALKDTNVPVYDSPERAARALKALWKYGQVKEKIKPHVVEATRKR